MNINDETKRLLAELEGESPDLEWITVIRKQIESCAARTGISFERALALIANANTYLPRGV